MTTTTQRPGKEERIHQRRVQHNLYYILIRHGTISSVGYPQLRYDMHSLNRVYIALGTHLRARKSRYLSTHNWRFVQTEKRSIGTA